MKSFRNVADCKLPAWRRGAVALPGVLFILCYAPALTGLVRQWAIDPEMSHGYFVLPVAGFIGWRRRAALAEAAGAPNWWGLAIAIWGAVQMLLGLLAAQVFIERTAILVSLAGGVLFLGGARALRVLAFPLGLLLFLFPIPAIIYAQVTLPLQIFASASAEAILNWIGVPVLRQGNILELAHARLSVIEACSGIRSLMSLTFLSLVYGHLFERRAMVRLLLVAGAAPIAIGANAGRIAAMGLFGGADHLLESWVIFSAALALLLFFHQRFMRVRDVAA